MKNRRTILGLLPAIMFFAAVMGQSAIAQAEKPVVGKTYDKSNYQEITEHLIPPIELYLKEGDLYLTVSKLDYEPKQYPPYQELSAKNEGKFDFDEAGTLVFKSTGKVVEYVEGNPFPTLDLKHPKIAQQIMENFAYSARYRTGSGNQAAESNWVGQGGQERQLISAGAYFYFQNRIGAAQIPNPNNYLQLTITGVYEPFNLRGTTSMAYSYNSKNEDTAFAYIPMLRRVRRTSAASRSDPHMGGDGCMDDAYGYAGKNGAMTFKFLGDMEALVAHGNTSKQSVKREPNGVCEKEWHYLKTGYQTPGWQGAPYMPVEAKWVVRPVWKIEMFPKDDYYNYGRQILYVDKDAYVIYNKEVYDRAGTYWKNIMVVWSTQFADDGEDFAMSTTYHQIDSKTRHAGVSHPIAHAQGSGRYRLPLQEFGPQDFTTNALIQRSK